MISFGIIYHTNENVIKTTFKDVMKKFAVHFKHAEEKRLKSSLKAIP